VSWRKPHVARRRVAWAGRLDALTQEQEVQSTDDAAVPKPCSSSDDQPEPA